MEQEKAVNISLIPILLVNFIGSLGFSIVLPFLVFLVTRFSGNPLLFGLMAAIYPLFQLIGAPYLGKWSDHYGRRKILLLSQAGTALAWFFVLISLFIPIVPIYDLNTSFFGVFFISIPFIILLFARALDGITGGNISVANAYIADITTEQNRKKNYGKMAVSSNLGFIIGPAMAGILGATIYGELLPILAALIISVIAIFVILWYLPESKPSTLKNRLNNKNLKKIIGQEYKECYNVKDSKKYKLKDVFKIHNIPYLLLLTFLIFLGFNFFYTSFPIHAANTLNWSITELGIFFAVLSGIMAFIQGPFLSRINVKTSDIKLIIIGSIILGFNFILLISYNIFIIYFAAVLFAIGNGLMWPSFLSFISKKAGKTYQGAVQGIASSFGSVASIIGLIAGGIIYAFIGVYVFLISAAIIFVVVILSIRFIKNNKVIIKQ